MQPAQDSEARDATTPPARSGGVWTSPWWTSRPPTSEPPATVEYVRKACVESGFFYVVKHGIEDGLLEKVFAESRRLFELPLGEKMALRSEVSESDNGNYGASTHSDYGMITLLATDGTPGLQTCKKDRHPQLCEDVHHIDD
ncbi:hypothetical protein ABZP36_011020 [Zizania latifolia]